jgi:hypothetical protein
MGPIVHIFPGMISWFERLAARIFEQWRALMKILPRSQCQSKRGGLLGSRGTLVRPARERGSSDVADIGCSLLDVGEYNGVSSTSLSVIMVNSRNY